MGCVHRLLLGSLDGGITVIHNAMLILFHSDNAVQGAVLFKLRGVVSERVQGQFSISELEQDSAVVSARIVHWQTTRDHHMEVFTHRNSQHTSQKCLQELVVWFRPRALELQSVPPPSSTGSSHTQFSRRVLGLLTLALS